MRKKLSFALTLGILLGFSGLQQAHGAAVKTISFQAEGWADNWYSLYINGKKVGEDAVPITTVRSFNSTVIKFTASYPFTIGVLAKDYTENASGLEYIGQSNQQIGDGGFVLQIRDLSTMKIVASTNKGWKSLVINKAPTNPTCAKSSNPLIECKFSNTAIPNNWSASTYSDSKWIYSTEFSQSTVGVKEGYFDIAWSDSAKLIWSSDLKLDNTILFRTTVKNAGQAASSISSETSSNLAVLSSDISATGALNKSATCDGLGSSPQISWSTPSQKVASYIVIMDTVPGPLRPGEVAGADHASLVLYNIPGTVHNIPSQNSSVGTFGQSFKGKFGYEAPCSQGPGEKVYTVSVYALSVVLSLPQGSATSSAITEAIQGKVIASGKLSMTYARQ